jgi:hypothetical protein
MAIKAKIIGDQICTTEDIFYPQLKKIVRENGIENYCNYFEILK